MGAAEEDSLAGKDVEGQRPFILATKLYPPRLRAGILPRSRLLTRLNTNLHANLTLISSPAGFGKSTLVAGWISQLTAGDAPSPTAGYQAAWLSIDQRDNDPIRFLTYFIAALQKIDEVVGDMALSWLHASDSPPLESVVAELINEIVAFPGRIVLVLDDFHVIENAAIHEALIFLLDNYPPNLHLIIITRADPPWPLARLRARRELHEIRAKELRFTPQETAVFLNNIKKLNLAPEDLQLLGQRTEGWITGLQMAALSMKHRGNTAAFVRQFSASNSFILDYLVEEVLEQQPGQLQTFLLQTAVLEHMNASLCNAVTGSRKSQAILHQLEQANLFLVPLDNERNWYRYHHLFADLLRRQLKETQPDLLPQLHHRASAWYQQAGQPDEAISHALAGDDLELATNLVRQNAFDAIRRNREVTLDRWLKALPEAMVGQRPWLCVAQAYIHQWLGLRTKVEDFLQLAEEALAARPRPLAGEERRLTGYIAAIRAHNALVDGDVGRVSAEAQKALAFMPEKDPWRMMPLIALGGAYWAQGDSPASENAFAAAAAGGRELGERVSAVSATCYVGMQQTKQGRLHQAFDTYQQALDIAVRSDGRPMPAAGFPLIKMADLRREWNDLAGAGEIIERGVEHCLRLKQSDVLTDAYINLARYHLAQGNRQEMLAALQKGDQLVAANPVDPWLTCWLDECRLRYWLSAGELEAAVGWAGSSGLTLTGELSYHHDLHHINLARVLVAQGQQQPGGAFPEEAQSLLARLLTAAKRAGWVHERIKILILRTLAHGAGGRQEEAIADLTQALTLAKPGGYVRLFLDEGDPLLQLLQQVATQDDKSGYAAKLVAQMGETPVPTVSPPSLLQPLSQREWDVLRLLNTHLSSSEIAQELFIAPSTVRSHIKNIYGKLNVHRRADAVQRAQELNLL